jgi:hypothetical protein
MTQRALTQNVAMTAGWLILWANHIIRLPKEMLRYHLSLSKHQRLESTSGRLTLSLSRSKLAGIVTYNQVKQSIIIILGLQGLCFTMVEVSER